MKKALRQQALAFRKQLNAETSARLGCEIASSLITLLQTFKPCTVGLFYPIRGEPNILEIMGNSSLGRFEWSLPVCCNLPTGPGLQFSKYSQADQLIPGQYNIPVPAQNHWVQPALLLIPCVAFHSSGARLGYGAGWYDRSLSQMIPVPVTIGVAYSGTEVSENFAEPHDRLLDYIVTDRGVLKCR